MNYKLKSDIELWESCKQDDIPAYNELFDRYAKILYRQTISYVKNEIDAEELVMDLLLSIWEKRNYLHIDSGKNVRAYFMLEMRRRIIKHFQKKT